MTHVAFAALVLLIGAIWVVRGRQIARLRSEIRELRAYVAHLDEADRLAHLASPGHATVTSIPRRRRHLRILPATLVIAGAAATTVLASSILTVSELSGHHEPQPESHQELPGPPVPSVAPAPSSDPTREPRPTPTEAPPARGEEDQADDEDPPPATPDKPRGTPTVEAEPAPAAREEEPPPEPGPVEEVVDTVVELRVDLGGAAPEPPTLLGKAVGE